MSATAGITGLPLEILWEEAAAAVAAAGRQGERRGGSPPAGLASRFAGELAVTLRPDRPTVIANFVSSIDGVVALAPQEGSGGGEISGFAEADRFLMAMLRALADVVIVGAGTVRVGKNHEWTPRRVQPELAAVFGEWRAQLGLAPQPTTIVVTASGALEPGQPGLRAPDVPVVVATTRAGAARLRALPFAANVTIEAVEDDGTGTVPAAAVLDVARRTGAGLALCEGGPHLFGDLLAAGLVDELFLTVAPQVLGRGTAGHRLGLVEGTSFGDGRDPANLGRWSRLAFVRRAGDHLFLRYRFAD